MLFGVGLLFYFAPIFVIPYLASFFFWENLLHRYIVPLFLEARSDFLKDEIIEEWLEKKLKKYFKGKPLFGSYNRVALLVDGVNEIQANLYGIFIEGCRALLQKKHSNRIVFTSRSGESPASRLGISNVISICNLDDEGVREFLRIYARETAIIESKPYDPNKVYQNYTALKDKNLLGEKDIGRNPYWLKMISESGIYTRNRGILFNTFVTKLIKREIEEKPEERKRKPDWKIVPIQVEMNVLANLALIMQYERRIGFYGEKEWKRAREIIRDSLEDLNYTPDDVLCEAESATLMRTKSKERIEFSHQLVQEFYAAYALKKNEKWKIDLEKLALNIKWWQTLFFLGGLLFEKNEPELYNKFVSQLIETGSDINNNKIFASLGVLLSVDEPPENIKTTILQEFINSIGKRLTNQQEKILQELVRILGNPVIVEILEELLNNKDFKIKCKVASLLLALKNEIGSKIIINKLSEDKNFLDVLKAIDDISLNFLIDTFKKENDEIREIVLNVLGNFDNERATDTVIETLHNKSLKVRIAAIRALGKKNNIKAVRPLLEIMFDNENELSKVIIIALREIGHPSVKLLIEDLEIIYKNYEYYKQNLIEMVIEQRGKYLKDLYSIPSLTFIALDEAFFGDMPKFKEKLLEYPDLLEKVIEVTGDLEKIDVKGRDYKPKRTNPFNLPDWFMGGINFDSANPEHTDLYDITTFSKYHEEKSFLDVQGKFHNFKFDFIKVIKIIGEIGNSIALPTLEKFNRCYISEDMKNVIEEAIKKISAPDNQKSSTDPV